MEIVTLLVEKEATHQHDFPISTMGITSWKFEYSKFEISNRKIVFSSHDHTEERRREAAKQHPRVEQVVMWPHPKDNGSGLVAHIFGTV